MLFFQFCFSVCLFLKKGLELKIEMTSDFVTKEKEPHLGQSTICKIIWSHSWDKVPYVKLFKWQFELYEMDLHS